MYMFKLHFFLKKRISIRNSDYDKIYKHWIKVCLTIKTMAFLELT